MALKIFKPITAGTRTRIDLVRDELTTDRPEKTLVSGKKSHAGRGAGGRISVRHQGGGHKRLYRDIDFKRNKHGIPGTVKTIEYDPNRTAFISLVCYADGTKKYILAPNGIKVGDFVPCYKTENNEIGLYDLVTCEFFGNSGTGNFLKGSDVSPGSRLPADYDELDYIESTGKQAINTEIYFESSLTYTIESSVEYMRVDVDNQIFGLNGNQGNGIGTAGNTFWECQGSTCEPNVVYNLKWTRSATNYERVINGVSYPVQCGLAAVFSDEGLEQIKENLSFYQENAKIISSTMDELGVKYTGGVNSPYIWFKCPNDMDSWTFFDDMLSKANVVGTPGAGFGKNGQKFFRLTSFGNREVHSKRDVSYKVKIWNWYWGDSY